MDGEASSLTHQAVGSGGGGGRQSLRPRQILSTRCMLYTVTPLPSAERGTTLPNLGHVSRDVVIPSETHSGEWEQLARTRLVAVVPRGGKFLISCYNQTR